MVKGELLGKMIFVQGVVTGKDDFCEVCFYCKNSIMCEQVVTLQL